MAADSSIGRVVGFAALGALILIVAIAFTSDKKEDDGAPETAPVSTAAAGTGAPSPVSDLPEVSAPSLTEQIPDVGSGTTITAVASDIALSPQARLLAERFQCVCGCKDILATCTCDKTPGSRDMKLYLQQLVDQGKTPGDIREAMIATYGTEVIP